MHRSTAGRLAAAALAFLSFLSFIAFAEPLRAQEPARETAPPALRAAVLQLDSLLFDAYNRCDLDRFGALLSPDLEFYHDQGGLAVGPQRTIDGVRQNICGKVTRQPVAGSIKVYEMKGYGALEIGVHRFYRLGEESKGPVGEASFVQLWKQDGGAWHVTRILSYDHHPLGAEP